MSSMRSHEVSSRSAPAVTSLVLSVSACERMTACERTCAISTTIPMGTASSSSTVIISFSRSERRFLNIRHHPRSLYQKRAGHEDRMRKKLIDFKNRLNRFVARGKMGVL